MFKGCHSSLWQQTITFENSQCQYDLTSLILHGDSCSDIKQRLWTHQHPSRALASCIYLGMQIYTGIFLFTFKSKLLQYVYKRLFKSNLYTISYLEIM